jgi:hypothetical protein
VQVSRRVADITGMEHRSDTSSVDDAVLSALGRARALGEPAAVLVVRLADPGAAEDLLSDVRASDTVAELGDGLLAVVLYRIGRLPAACVAERFQRRTGGSNVGMTCIEPWERRAPGDVVRAALTDLRERDAAAASLAAA